MKPGSRSTRRPPVPARSGSTVPSSGSTGSLASSTRPPGLATNARWAKMTGRCSRPGGAVPCSPEAKWSKAKYPTTPTTASIIAGIQVQEAVKYLHGLETHLRPGLHLRRDISSELPGKLHPQGRLPGARRRSAGRGRFRGRLRRPAWAICSSESGRISGREAIIETGRDLLASLHCPACGEDETVFRLAGKNHGSAGPLPALRASREPRPCSTRSTAAIPISWI